MITRRQLIIAAGKIGGAAAAFGVMDGLGLMAQHAHAQTTGWKPPSAGDFAGKTRADKRVVILGAGVTGMAAAYELAKAGYDCRILEARNRPGGRVWTVRRGDVETEVGGEPQRVEFDKGYYHNPGPARIPQHHITIDYCKELGVALEIFTNVNDDAYIYNEGVGPLSGVKVRKRTAKADIRGYVTELLAKVSPQALDTGLTAEDGERLLAFLRSYGGLSATNAYVPSNRRGYDTLPTTEPGVVGSAYSFSDLLQSQWGSAFAFEFGFDQAMNMFQPIGGMDKIASALAAAIPGRITYGSEVTEIRQSADGVRVVHRTGGRLMETTGDYCICTIPLSVLSGITANSDFTPERKAGIAAVAYADTGKIALQMKRRFWEEDERILGGITSTNMDLATVWYPSDGFLVQPKGIMVGYYNFGAQAVAYGNLSLAERQARALAQGAKIHPQYPAEFENSFSVAWQKVQYSLGGWASWTTDTRTNIYPLLLQPDGRVYLAGEHMSYIGSWQAGGFESARRVVTEIHERAVATAS